jgi:carboxyl-terminal processing protease
MKKLLLVAASSFALSVTALASPATDLLDQGVNFMTLNYHGYSTVSPAELGAKLRTELEGVCAGSPTCAASSATPFLQRLTSEMNDGHTYYLPPIAYQQNLQAFSGANTNPNPTYGLVIGNLNSRGEVLIADVVADSPAFEGGLRPFDRVVSVNGTRLQTPVPASGVRAPQPGNVVSRFRELLQTDALVTLRVLRGDVKRPRIATVRMQRRKLTKTNLPFLYQPATAPKGVLVMRFPTFVGSNDIAPRTHALVAEAQAQLATGIVLDLRGNGGGEETECYGAASAFIGRAVNINETVTQKVLVGFDGGKFIGNDPQDPVKFEIPKPALWKGNVAVLVDSGTASCGELMAYFMQTRKRGAVIGEQTYGVLDTATEFWKLLDGSALAITYVRTQNEDGSRVPEFVTPDVSVPYDLNLIAETGRDPMLEAAIGSFAPKVAQIKTSLPAILDPLGGWDRTHVSHGIR